MIITTDAGVRIDVSEQVQRLLMIHQVQDFRSPQNAHFIRTFGRKLVVVAGPHAPGAIIAGLDGAITGPMADHLAQTWAEAVEEMSNAARA